MAGGAASTGMEGGVAVGGGDEAAAANQTKVERLSQGVQQQLNLESVKTRAVGLSKAISRILEDFDAIARSSSVPKWYSWPKKIKLANPSHHHHTNIGVNLYFTTISFLFWQARCFRAVFNGQSGAV